VKNMATVNDTLTDIGNGVGALFTGMGASL
jgi:hypothetical protein